MNRHQTMKRLVNPLKILATLAVVALATGCASTSNVVNKQNLVMAAGFKIITPSTPDQRSLLTSLPPDKVTSITYKGKPYYVLPDVANNRAFVGGPQEYNAYRVNRADQNLANEDLNAAKWDDTVSQMGTWNGWAGTTFAR
jgi:hypothetical protein